MGVWRPSLLLLQKARESMTEMVHFVRKKGGNWSGLKLWHRFCLLFSKGRRLVYMCRRSLLVHYEAC